jgi:hypothetical protein
MSVISSMAMDASNVDEIMKVQGGVASLVGSMETAKSSRMLEETARTVARLAASPKNVPMLIESGALNQICNVIKNGNSNPDMQASMVVALNRIAQSQGPQALHAICVEDPKVVEKLAETLKKTSDRVALAGVDGVPGGSNQMKATLELFGRFDQEHLAAVDVKAVSGSILAAMKAHGSDDSKGSEGTAAGAAVIKSSLLALSHVVQAGGESGAASSKYLVESGAVPVVLNALASDAATDSPQTTVAALGVLGGLAGGGDSLAAATSAANNGGELSAGIGALRAAGSFGAVVDCVGKHSADVGVRSAAAGLLQVIASDNQINDFGGQLSTFSASFASGSASEADIAAIPQLALGLGALAMVPQNISKIQAAGGVAPMTALMGAVADMKDCPNQDELLCTFSNCLTEVVANTGAAAAAAAAPAVSSTSSITQAPSTAAATTVESGLDPATIMKNCVSALTKHEGKTNVCTSTLRLMRTALASAKQDLDSAVAAAEASGDESAVEALREQGNKGYAAALVACGGVDAIATQIRLHPSDDNPELLNHALAIYAELSTDPLVLGSGDNKRGGAKSKGKAASSGGAGATADNQRATDIVQRSGRQLVRCLEETSALHGDDPAALAALVPCLTVLGQCAATPQGRAITSKLGAIKSVMAVLDAASAANLKEDPQAQKVVAACSQTLSAVVTSSDVVRVVQRLHQRLETLKVASGNEGELDAVNAVSEDVKKLGLLSMCGDFNDAIIQAGGQQVLVDIINEVEATMASLAQEVGEDVATGGVGGAEASAREALVRQCLTAFGRSLAATSSSEGKGLDVQGVQGIVPALVRCLEEPTVEVLHTVGALAAFDSTLMGELVRAGAVEAIVPLLEDGVLEELLAQSAAATGGGFGVADDDGDGDKQSSDAQAAGVNACMEALASFCLSSEGVSHVVASGGLAFVVEHLREDMAIGIDEAADEQGGASKASKAIASAVSLLSNVAEHGGETPSKSGGSKGGDVTQKLLDAGVLGLVSDSLSMLQTMSTKSGKDSNEATAVADVKAMADLQRLLVSLMGGGAAPPPAAEGATPGGTDGGGGNAEEVASAIMASGVLQQVDALMSAPSSAFVSSPQCVLATSSLLGALNSSGQTQALHAPPTSIAPGTGSAQSASSATSSGSTSVIGSSPVLMTSSAAMDGIDAEGLMMRMMNANSTDIEVARACAKTVGVLYSTSPEAVASADAAGPSPDGTAVAASPKAVGMFARILAQSEAALSKAQASAVEFDKKSAEADPSPAAALVTTQCAESLAADLDQVASSLQLLGNVVLLEEGVDQEAVNQAMAVAQPLLALLPSVKVAMDKQASTASPASSDNSDLQQQLGAAGDAASSSALMLCGRLANLEHVEVDTAAVTEATALYIEDDTVSDTVFASAVSCLGGVAASQRGVKSIAKRGMVAKMQTKTTQRKRVAGQQQGAAGLAGGKSGGRSRADAAAEQMASVTASALDAIKKQAVSNAASLVAAEGGAAAIASILTSIASNAAANSGKGGTKQQQHELEETLNQIVAEQGGLQVLLQVLCEMNTGPQLSSRLLNASAGPPPCAGGFAGGAFVRTAVDALVVAMLEHRNSGKATISVHSPAEAASLVAAAGLGVPIGAIVAAEKEAASSARARAASVAKPAGSASATPSAAELLAEEEVFSRARSAAVVLLEGLPRSEGGVAVCTRTPAVLEAIVSSCSSPNLAVASASMGCLAHLASKNDPSVNARLVASRAAPRALVVLKALLAPGSGDFTTGEKVAVKGVDASGSDGAALVTLQDLERKGRSFLASSVFMLATLLATVGAKPCGLQGREAMRVVKALHESMEAAGAAKNNPFALDQCGRALTLLQAAFEDGADAALEASLRSLSKLDKKHKAWQGVEDGKGQGAVYFYNANTAETMWERPPDHEKLLEELNHISELVEAVGGTLDNVEPKVVAFGLVPLLTSHARDKHVMGIVCPMLMTACRTTFAGSVLARHELIGDVVVVLENHLEVDPVVSSCAAAVVHRLSVASPRFVNVLSNPEYLPVLAIALRNNPDDAKMCERLLVALARAVEGDAQNAKLCFDKEGMDCLGALALCFEKHNGKSREVSAAALAVLEVLLSCVDEFGDDEEEPFGDDEQRDQLKISICKTCCSGLLKGMELYGCEPTPPVVLEEDGGIGGPKSGGASGAGGGDAGGAGGGDDDEDDEGGGQECSYFLSVVRCLGSLSLVDDCIVTMVEGGACRLTVLGLRKWHGISEAASSSMELVSNMGAIEDDELDEAMTQYLIDEEALEAVVEVMTEYDTEVPVLLVTYEAMYNIGNDESAAGKLVEMGVVKLAFTTLQNFDYEKLLVAQVMKFLSVLTYDARAVTEVAELGWLPIVFQALQTRQDLEEFVLDALMCVCNSVQDPRNQKLVLEDKELLKQLLELLNKYADSSDVASQVVITCIRLSTNEDVSVLMASEGMPFFMRTTAHLGMANTELLSLLFELLFYLAFVKENIKVIVQHGGIKVLCAVMEVEEYQQNVELMLKAVGMMDNVVSASEEFATVVADKGGRQLVEELREVHGEGEEELFGAATSALLSMDAMMKKKEQEGSKTGRAALFARLGADAVALGAGAQGGVIKSDKSMSQAPAAGEGAEEDTSPDVLAEHRALLLRGAPTKLWTKGVPCADGGVRIFATDEFNALILKETADRNRAGTRLALKSLGGVSSGVHGEGHLKKGTFSSSCKEPKDRCMSLFEAEGGKEAYALSFQSKEACEKWAVALTTLLEVAKNKPKRLKG